MTPFALNLANFKGKRNRVPAWLRSSHVSTDINMLFILDLSDWNDWSSWSACSVTCGSGVTSRTRSCPTPGNCVGKNAETGSCQTTLCPREETRADVLAEQIQGVLESMNTSDCQVTEYTTDFEEFISSDLVVVLRENELKSINRHRIREHQQKVLNDQERFRDQELSRRYRRALANYRVASLAFADAVNAYEEILDDVWQATDAYSREFLECQSGSSEYAILLRRYLLTILRYHQVNNNYVKAFFGYLRAHDNYCTCLQESRG